MCFRAYTHTRAAHTDTVNIKCVFLSIFGVVVNGNDKFGDNLRWIEGKSSFRIVAFWGTRDLAKIVDKGLKVLCFANITQVWESANKGYANFEVFVDFEIDTFRLCVKRVL